MYQLTCPTCRCLTTSPFVRTGAVVRCAGCQSKYRIKTAHVERVLKTGPRTLDEADTVLRNDSVDIDPDEIAPVSIDDEGNVVGLSGLSELMRQSDAQGARDRVQAKMDQPPSATSRSSKSKAKPLPPGVVRVDEGAGDESGAANRRSKLLARRRRKRTQAIVIVALACLLVVSGVVVTMMVIRRGDRDRSADDANADTGKAGPGAGALDKGDDKPDKGSTPQGIGEDERVQFGPPSPNTNKKFVPPWVVTSLDALPTDVPTVVTPSRRIAHEGWYIMSPPRGSASAAGEADIEISDLIPEAGGEGQTVLVGSVKNGTERVLLDGELHVMLLDSSARVFAETYTPLVMIDPQASQKVALSIASRHWQRARGVRTEVVASAWSDRLSPMPGVELQPAGKGAFASLRISARNQSGSALRGVLILIEATDAQGGLVDRFVVENEKLYVSGGDWLDLVVATPLPAGREAAQWSVLVQPR